MPQDFLEGAERPSMEERVVRVLRQLSRRIRELQ